MAQDALARDAVAIAVILAGEPHADPRSRNPGAIVLDLEDQVHATLSDAERRAAAAVEHAQEARGRLRLRDRLIPWPTPAKRQAAAAAFEAERLQLAAQGARADLRDALRQAYQRAGDIAKTREREHVAWESRPDVVAAKESQRLNEAIDAAVAAGDPQLTALAAVGEIRTARGVIRRREAAIARRQVMERLRIEEAEPNREPIVVGWSPSISQR